MADKKRSDVRNIAGSTLAGAGGVTAGTGLLAGGIPHAKSDFSSVFDVKRGEGKGPRKIISTVRGAAPARKAVPGGILGFRLSAHKGGTYGFQQFARKNARKGAQDNAEAFHHARNVGKIPAEAKVMRGMARARSGANAAFVGGVGATAEGLHLRKKPVNKRDRNTDTYNSALLGAGGAGTVISHQGSKSLGRFQRKYERAASDSVDRAGQLVPKIAGREGKKLSLRQMHQHKLKNPGQPFPKSMYPSVSDQEIKRNPHLLGGVPKSAASAAGHLRGQAAQERHFAEVFGSTAKAVRRFRTPSAVVAATGAGGLAVSSHKKKVSKRMSAFGVEH